MDTYTHTHTHTHTHTYTYTYHHDLIVVDDLNDEGAGVLDRQHELRVPPVYMPSPSAFGFRV